MKSITTSSNSLRSMRSIVFNSLKTVSTLILTILVLLNSQNVIKCVKHDDFDYDSESFYDLNQIDEDMNKKSNIQIEDEYLQSKRKEEYEKEQILIAQNERERMESEGLNYYDISNDVKNGYKNNQRNNINSHPRNTNKKAYDEINQLNHLNNNMNVNNRINNNKLLTEKDLELLNLGLDNNDEIINNKFQNNRNSMYNHNPNYNAHHAHNNNRHNMMNNMGNMGMGNNIPHNVNTNNNDDNSGIMSWMVKNPFLSSIYEGLALVFMMGFVYKCLFMRNSNDKNILSWYKANKELLQNKLDKEAFYHYDNETNTMNSRLYDKNDQPDNSYPIFKQSEKFFLYHGEEGSNVRTFDVRLEFHKNQDYLFLITQFLVNEKDRIYYEVVLNYNEYYPQLFVLCKQKQASNITSMNKDIKELCINKHYYHNFDLECLNEDNEMMKFILGNERMRKMFMIFRGSLDLVLFTECEGKDKKLIVTFETDLGAVIGNEKVYVEMTNFVIELADLISSYSPTEDNIDQLTLKRKAYFNKLEGKNLNNEDINSLPDSNNKEPKKEEPILQQSTYQNNTNKGDNTTNKNNKGKNKDKKKKKYEWEEEGLYAFTNSKCSSFKPKTIFFK